MNTSLYITVYHESPRSQDRRAQSDRLFPAGAVHNVPQSDICAYGLARKAKASSTKDASRSAAFRSKKQARNFAGLLHHMASAKMLQINALLFNFKKINFSYCIIDDFEV